MHSELCKFLKSNLRGENKPTHVIPSKGSYNIKKEDLNEFYKLLHDDFFIHKNKYMCVEKLGETCSLVIDLDFKYKTLFTERQYTQETINSLIKLFFSKLDELFDLEDNQYQVWIFEKPNIREIENPKKPKKPKNPNNTYLSKDGVHLVFPNIKAPKELFKHFVTLINNDEDLFLDMLKETSISLPDNSADDIVDKSIYGTNWMMYGSCKDDESTRYELTTILSLNSQGEFKNFPIDMYLENPLTIIENNSVYNTEKNVTYTEYAENYLKKKNLNTNIENNNIMEDNNDNNNELINVLHEKEFELIKILINKLDDSRSEPYDSWRDVGLMLHNFSKSKEMLNLWKEFSKKADNYDEKSCIDKWKVWKNNIKNEKPLTIRTLHWWVKQDIPIDEYRDIIKDSLEIKIINSLQGEKNTGAHYDVANVISDYYKNEFVCSGLKENFWYFFNEYNGGRWEATEIGHELRKKLSREICDIYIHYTKKYQEESKKYDEGTINKNYYDKLVSNCGKIISKLKDSIYKDKIIRECRELFYDPEFNIKLNSKLDLIGFDNGVFDLEKMEFRKGQPDDYVNVTTNYSLPVYDLTKPISFDLLYRKINNDPNYKKSIEELDEFIKQVLPNRGDKNAGFNDERTREYVLRFLSSCLSGNVREEKFYFWTGSGGNGKSKLIELLDLTLGDYSKTLDVAYLTTKRGSSSSASPEVETLKYARFVSCSEPEEDDKIYVGKLKQITGGDKLTTRGLYKETTEFKPQFKIILMCNDLPKLQNQDGGTWRRIEVVDFISKFTDNPIKTDDDPNQFVADINLSAKLESWKLLFMITLLSNYKEYSEIIQETGKPRGTNPPSEVKAGTEAYKETSDIISSWFNNDVEECDYDADGKAPTHIDDLYSYFKSWCTDEGINKKEIPLKKKLRDSLIKEQDKSKYGGKWGRKEKNGTKNSPSFNFQLITLD